MDYIQLAKDLLVDRSPLGIPSSSIELSKAYALVSIAEDLHDIAKVAREESLRP